MFLLFFTMFSFPKIFSKQIKLCIDCKHFKKDFFSTNKFGKCSLFPIDDYEYNKYYFVDGYQNEKKQNYYFCSTVRHFDSMCGNEGKLFVKRN